MPVVRLVTNKERSVSNKEKCTGMENMEAEEKKEHFLIRES